MSVNPPNDTWKQQSKKLVRATFKKGFVVAVNTGAVTMDVSFAENPQTVLRNIPAAKSITLANVSVGQKCRVDLFDETNPNDMVVAYVY